MERTDKSVKLLKLLGGRQQNDGIKGLQIVRVVTTNPVTVVFEGSPLSLDIDIFEVPRDFLPLTQGAKFFALPIQGGSQRWGLIQKIT